MSDDYGFGGLFILGKIMIALCVVFVPLGMWKLIEIVMWIWRHFHIVVHDI